MSGLRSLHLRGALGAVRTEMWEGREHLVVPMVALMEGVIHAVNAPSAEFVPRAALEASVGKWAGHPIVIGHPTKNGKQISAHDPTVLAERGCGFIRSSAMENGRLVHQTLIDPARLVALKQDVLLADLRAGNNVEVSVGAFVNTNDTKSTYNGKRYAGEWIDIGPDHTALLPGGVGACSLAMGCGAHRAAEAYLVTAEGFEALAALPDKSEVCSTCKGSGKIRSGKVKCPDCEGMKGASMSVKSLKARVLALFDAPEDAAAEEAAELVAYNSMRVQLDAANDQLKAASALVDELIADEEENPTATRQQETAEEEVEDARLDAIRMHCYTMIAALQSVCNACSDQQMPDVTPSDPRYMEVYAASIGKNANALTVAEKAAALRTAIGKAISAKNAKTIQAAHDASHEVHTHTVALGAECSGMKAAAKSCEACDGTGQVKEDGKQKDCAACDGTGTLKAAEAAQSTLRAACGCKESEMAKKERIAALLGHEPIKAWATEKALEALDDAQLTALEAQCEKQKTELKAAQDAKDAAESKLKAAEANQIPAEELASLRTLADEKKQKDAAVKADLVTKLAAASTALTKEQLEAKPLDELKTLAAFAKVPAADFSIKGMPVHRAAEGVDQYAPPDPYKKTAVN